MARLIDDIRSQGIVENAWVKPEAYNRWMPVVIENFRKCRFPVILADNVASYYWSFDLERWRAAATDPAMLVKEFPNLAPPYQEFWIEYRIPQMVVHDQRHGDKDLAQMFPHGRVGVWFQYHERGDSEPPEEESWPDGTHWIMDLEFFLQTGASEPVQGCYGTWSLYINQEGLVLGRPWMKEVPDLAQGFNVYMTWFGPALLAVAFLHCHNVKVVDNPVPPKLAKRYRERHEGQEPSPHKTLVIEPLKEILRTQGRSNEVGLMRALHICRGHFRDYTQGKGLFGKYRKWVWQPVTVRGKKRKPEEEPPEREIKIKV